MRLKIIIFILAMFAFLSASTGAWLYYFSYREAAWQKVESDALTRLHLLAGQFSTHLSEHVKSVKTLAGLSELGAVFEQKNLKTIFEANQILDHFTQAMDLDVSYLIDADGITLCSSNRNVADSFVGHDFSFRPYFNQAIKGKPATYLALGTTSNKRGVYFSYPVIDPATRKVQGVAVIKSSVEFLEATLFHESGSILLFTDPMGVIFMSNAPAFKFKVVQRLDEDALDTISDSRQFGIGPWTWSGLTPAGPEKFMDRSGKTYLTSRLEIKNYPGWHILSLRDETDIQKQVSGLFIRIIGPVVLVISVLAGLLVVALYQMASRELGRRIAAETNLKISERRYRQFYHKTPVMLHSIDQEGRIVHVSDHWVEVMGYDRSEVIGRHLTEFFADHSKRFALDSIFPRFFSTGFCKDIPYTYVKHNGEHMETLLSCYGLRDAQGNIIRSLAVSVDVTEKNRVHKALEKAKEQLSNYSQDLEGQVRRRTFQLEAAQSSLKKLSKNIIASQEREKELMARELHDHLGQVLTALRIDAVWAEKHLRTIDEAAGARAAKMSTLIDTTIQDVRDMAYRLRPRVLDDLGLADALESLVSDFERRSNVSCVFRHDEIPLIDKTLATAVYRIGQEALTNSLRHSSATTILVELRHEGQNIVLTVEDDGCGFSINENEPLTGFGLESMKERANLAGGRFHIASAQGKGTFISCTISLKGDL